MKNVYKVLGIIALVVMVFGCSNGSTDDGDFTITITGIPDNITNVEIEVGGLQPRPATVSGGTASASIESYKLEPPFTVVLYDKTNDVTYYGATSYTTKESITVGFSDFSQ